MSVISLILCLMIPSETELVGAWKFLSVDKKNPHHETLYFYPDHKLVVDGNDYQRGSYKVEKGELIMTLKLAGSENVQRVTLTIEGKKMKLGSRDGSSNSYEKLEKSLPPYKAEGWRSLKVDHITVDVPNAWNLNKLPANPDGSQRLTMQSIDGQEAVTLMRIPDRKDKEVKLADALKNMMRPVAQSLGVHAHDLKGFNGTFYNKEGHQLEILREVNHKNVIARTFGMKLKSGAYMVAMITFESGDETRIKRIMESAMMK